MSETVSIKAETTLGLADNLPTVVPQNVTPTSVSVVVPVYAGEAYLRALVEAVAAVREEWSRAGRPLRKRATQVVGGALK